MLKEIIYRYTIELGIDAAKMLRAVRGFLWYLRSYKKFKRLLKKQPDGWSFSWPYPCLSDRGVQSGGASGHYFHQDLWVAQNIFKIYSK